MYRASKSQSADHGTRRFGVAFSRRLALAIALAALPTAAAGQDYQALMSESLKRAFGANDLSQRVLLGPIWLDSVYVNEFQRSVGVTPATRYDWLEGAYRGTSIRAIASLNDVTLRGAGDDPRHEALVRLTEIANGTAIKRPPAERLRNPVEWIRDGGVYAAIRVFSETDPTRDNLGLKVSTDPAVVRFEVIHKFTSWYYMPVGTSVVYEAKWTNGRWDVREIARKVF